MASERSRDIENEVGRYTNESPQPNSGNVSDEFYYNREDFGDDVIPGEEIDPLEGGSFEAYEDDIDTGFEDTLNQRESVLAWKGTMPDENYGFMPPLTYQRQNDVIVLIRLTPCGVLQKLCGQRGESDHCGLEYVGGRCFMIGNHDVDDSFLATTEPGAVSRLVIIDGPNVLHGYRSLTGNEDRKLDAVHLLSLVRFFVSRGIECMVVTLHKYMLESVTENTFIMREQGLLMVMDKTYDDLMLFAVAGEFDGVILSEDQFKAEQQRQEFMTPNVSPIYPRAAANFLPKSEWGRVSRNGHFVVDHLLRFAGSTQELRSKFFSSPARGGYRFELVEEKHATWLKRKEKVLKTLDRLVAKIQPIMMKTREDVPTLLPRGN